MLCKRTNDPKLSWLEHELLNKGIKSRRNGKSFYAPILEVKCEDEEAALGVLCPIDNIPDDDRRYSKFK